MKTGINTQNTIRGKPSQEQIVANSFKNMLEVFGVKNIKEIEFNGSYMFIRFASKVSAFKALECRFIKKYEYTLKPSIFKFKHELVGLAIN